MITKAKGGAGPWNPLNRWGGNLPTDLLVAFHRRPEEPVWFYHMTPNHPFETLPAEVADLKPGQPHHGVNRPGAYDPDQRGYLRAVNPPTGTSNAAADHACDFGAWPQAVDSAASQPNPRRPDKTQSQQRSRRHHPAHIWPSHRQNS
jgi:hypothetical protein